jgi:hypothetical protein
MSRATGGGTAHFKTAVLYAALLILLTFLLSTIPARACPICFPYPPKTSVDYVIGSETVVFARADPAARFSYAPTEVLKGRYDGKDIPLLVDSVTVRTLELNAALQVILVQDRREGTWSSLGVAGREYQGILREVARWDASTKTPAERAMFFSPHLRSDDDALRELAFLEAGRAPYSTIRNLAAHVPRAEIYRALNNLFRVEWHPLYILMLGMSDRPDDIAFVRRRLDAAVRHRLTTNLSAYATAYIEMVDTDAVRLLSEEYFREGVHSAEELREILKALSTHGNTGSVELRGVIVDAYGELLAHRPELAGLVAGDLRVWKATRFAPRMKAILNGNIVLDEPSELAITTYLSIGRRERDATILDRPSQ